MAQSPASTRLSDQAKSTLRLILRSPDMGDGWRRVSPPCWAQLIEVFPHQELLETRMPSGTDHPSSWGQVRLSPRGLILVDYI